MKHIYILNMFHRINKIIDKIIIISTITISSSYFYCSMNNQNAIHVWYRPHYMLWMTITSLFFGKKILEIKEN